MAETVSCSLDSKSIPLLMRMLVAHEPATLEDLPEVGPGETVIGEMNDTMRRIEACIQSLQARASAPETTLIEIHTARQMAAVLNALKWVEVAELFGPAIFDDNGDSVALRKGGVVVRMDSAATLQDKMRELFEKLGAN